MPTALAAQLAPDRLRDVLASAAGDFGASLDVPNLLGARASASLFRGCLHVLSEHARLEDDAARLVDSEALYLAFEAFVAFRSGATEEAAAALLDAWTSTTLAELHAPETVQIYRREIAALRGISETVSAAVKTFAESTEDYQEWLILFHQAVEQVISSEVASDRGRSALRSLMTRLELGQDDLGRMFGVSGETVRRWERGLSTIPAERRSAILAAEAGLRKLQDLFLPQRLATAVRRPAELFDGESALDWILRGRIAEVASRYDAALLYQA